jgi:hypothetical protein
MVNTISHITQIIGSKRKPYLYFHQHTFYKFFVQQNFIYLGNTTHIGGDNMGHNQNPFVKGRNSGGFSKAGITHDTAHEAEAGRAPSKHGDLPGNVNSGAKGNQR